MHYLHVPPVVVFLRNLSLLQLDELPDRPDLSTRIFAGGQHTLRQRVKGVEWALYHLFVIWDPEGTRNVRFLLPHPPSMSAISDMMREGFPMHIIEPDAD
jgi:hypothetical protein